MEINQTKLLPITRKTNDHIISKKEGNGHVEIHSKYICSYIMDIHPNRVEPALIVDILLDSYLVRNNLENDQERPPLVRRIDSHDQQRMYKTNTLLTAPDPYTPPPEPLLRSPSQEQPDPHVPQRTLPPPCLRSRSSARKRAWRT